MNAYVRTLGVCAIVVLAEQAPAQFLVIGDSSNDRIMTFDPFDGSLIDPDFIVDADGSPYDFATPKDAINVGNEIWVADQIADAVYRFDLSGGFIDAITTGLDNIRGMAFVNGTVYVSNSGTDNDAPGDAVVMFDTAGNNLGSFAVGNGGDPFDVFAYNGELLISDIANEAIQRHDLAGNFLGTFHDSDGVSGIDFPQQLASRGDNVLAAGFSPPAGLYEYDDAGNQIAFYDAVDDLRGVFVLGNGNILVTNTSGVWALDPDTDTATLIVGGVSAQFINLVVPAPSSFVLLGLGALATRRRR